MTTPATQDPTSIPGVPHLVWCEAARAHFQPTCAHIEGGYAQIECELHDANGRRRGEPGYTRNMPAFHTIKLQETPS
jgi:hypothetical protein